MWASCGGNEDGVVAEHTLHHQTNRALTVRGMLATRVSNPKERHAKCKCSDPPKPVDVSACMQRMEGVTADSHRVQESDSPSET